MLQQRSCRWICGTKLFLSLQAARGAGFTPASAVFTPLLFVIYVLGYVSGSSLLCMYPEELNEFAKQPAGNFQGDKANFCTPTSSTENRAAENEKLGLFEYCGSLQH